METVFLSRFRSSSLCLAGKCAGRYASLAKPAKQKAAQEMQGGFLQRRISGTSHLNEILELKTEIGVYRKNRVTVCDGGIKPG